MEILVSLMYYFYEQKEQNLITFVFIYCIFKSLNNNEIIGIKKNYSQLKQKLVTKLFNPITDKYRLRL